MRRITSRDQTCPPPTTPPLSKDAVARPAEGRPPSRPATRRPEQANLEVRHINPKLLVAYGRNPRTHSPSQIRQICRSIREFGFLIPVLADSENGIIAGHARTLAAIELGLATVPVVRVDHLSPHQIRAYVIADNKLAENAGWDAELLALELEELSVIPDFDVTVTGFETPEIDILIGEATEESFTEEEEPVPEPDRSSPAVTKLGDLWQIGKHRLLCGDALERNCYHTLMGSTRAQIVLTDPPFNVPIAGHVSGLGRANHREFPMASGEMSPEAFTTFLQKVFAYLASFSKAGSLHFVFMDWRHLREMLDAGEKTYTELKNLCVWVKTNAGMGSLYRSQHELVFVWKNGTTAHTNNVELSRFGRNRSNVWTYAGMNSFGKERDVALAFHPTVKPTALLADTILDCSVRGAAVLDPFCGSGSTLVAAEKTGRRGYGIELDPHYVDTAIQRLTDATGHKAKHVRTNLTFDELAGKRARSRSN